MVQYDTDEFGFIKASFISNQTAVGRKNELAYLDGGIGGPLEMTTLTTGKRKQKSAKVLDENGTKKSKHEIISVTSFRYIDTRTTDLIEIPQTQGDCFKLAYYFL